MTFTYGTRQHWDSVARTRIAKGTALSDAMRSSMVHALGEVAGKRILDIGTGIGKLPIALATLGARAVGIDVTAVGIDLAKATAREDLGETDASKRLEFFTMDASSLAFEDGEVDAITCLKTLWCFPKVEPCLREFARVLAPGGSLVAQIYGPPDECPLLTLGPRILGELDESMQVPKDYRSAFDFSPEVLARLLGEAGFGELHFEEYALEVDLPTRAAYWETLRSVAGSAYYAYTRLAPEHGEEIDRAWDRRVARVSDERGAVRLGLTWLVCTARTGTT